jgi:hypothetical protein
VIYKILPDKDKLWFTTNNGMYCYQPLTSSLKFYNKKDGLQENLFLPNSGIQLSDGTIMVGGVNGFNEFRPDKIQVDTQIPTVILTDFQLFNKPVVIGSEDSPLKVSITYADRLVLDYSHSMFSFSVSALSYINTSKNKYRYRLEGFEKDWTETNDAPHVTYTNLPAGDYVFQVSASNSDGMWNENAIAFPIKVLPPWWASSYMIVGYDESFEFRIFDEEYLKFRHFLVQNNFAYFRVMIKEGWVNKETGKKSDPKIVFTHVQYLQDVLVDFAKKLTIQMPIEDLKEQLIQRLNELFQGHQGNLNVTFEVLELEKVTRQIERKMEIEEEFISDEEEGSETLVMESQMEEVEELIIKNKLEMPSRKLKVGISKELLEELEKMQLKFKLN